MFIASIGLAEYASYRLSRRPDPLDPTQRTAIIVLGYPTGRNGKLHPIQRWRTQIAVRTLKQVHDGWLIFSGGVTRRAVESEAAVMARYATSDLGVARERIELEEEARSTWDNIKYSAPMVEAGAATQVVIVSDAFHADKARRYLTLQYPEMSRRVARALDYRVLKRWWFKVLYLAYYVKVRANRSYGSPPPGFDAAST